MLIVAIEFEVWFTSRWLLRANIQPKFREITHSRREIQSRRLFGAAAADEQQRQSLFCQLSDYVSNLPQRKSFPPAEIKPDKLTTAAAVQNFEAVVLTEAAAAAEAAGGEFTQCREEEDQFGGQIGLDKEIGLNWPEWRQTMTMEDGSEWPNGHLLCRN